MKFRYDPKDQAPLAVDQTAGSLLVQNATGWYVGGRQQLELPVLVSLVLATVEVEKSREAERVSSLSRTLEGFLEGKIEIDPMTYLHEDSEHWMVASSVFSVFLPKFPSLDPQRYNRWVEYSGLYKL
jgi:hypothetical protein